MRGCGTAWFNASFVAPSTAPHQQLDTPPAVLGSTHAASRKPTKTLPALSRQEPAAPRQSRCRPWGNRASLLATECLFRRFESLEGRSTKGPLLDKRRPGFDTLRSPSTSMAPASHRQRVCRLPPSREGRHSHVCPWAALPSGRRPRAAHASLLAFSPTTRRTQPLRGACGFHRPVNTR